MVDEIKNNKWWYNLPNKKGRWMWRRRESWEGGDGEDGGLAFAMEKVDVDEERRYKIDG